ncbi:Mitochondrial division protein 1 [Grifola frondosa]|uniref:Mitochondrial division protein 1 n=1 Tax=Grifola frondosa TaxID=5627 RepID=A0A1C7MS52_GRIFR|nr:Mitochondrial division protein 1 [Grifola frondosa]
MASSNKNRRTQEKKRELRLEPPAQSSSSSSAGVASKLDVVSKAIMAPFSHRKHDSTKLFADLAPVIMTPRMMNAATTSGRPRSSLGGSGTSSSRMDFATLGRAPLSLGFGSRRITSRDLQIVEVTEELLEADVPEPEGVASNVSLLRGFNATIPSAEKGRIRRRQTRNVEAPRLGLKKLGMSARGMMAEDDEHEGESVESEEDVVMVETRGRGKAKRKGRQSLSAGKTFGPEELKRQTHEIERDKENLHVRRALINNEIAEISNKIDALDAIRAKLEQDLLRLQEDELELDDELEGVRERLELEEATSISTRGPSHANHLAHSSRRRKGPVFLPSEHDELPPGVAFMSLTGHTSPITALDFSEPYGTLVSASQEESQPRVWDLLSGEEIGRLRGHRGMVKCMQVEDHICLTGRGKMGNVRLWDLRRVEEDEDWEKGEMLSLSDVTEEESTDGEHVKANGIRSSGSTAPSEAERDGSVWLQCVMTMDILWAISHPPAAAPGAALPNHLFPGAAASAGTFAVPTPPYADGTWEIGDGAVRMWDMRTGQPHRTLLGHTGPVTCLQFDELHIISGSLDKSIRIWDLRTGGIFETLKYDHAVTALQFDTRKIVAATGENGIKIYNRTSMQQSTLTTNGHIRPVEKLRYMDRYLVSGGRDSIVKIWAL